MRYKKEKLTPIDYSVLRQKCQAAHALIRMQRSKTPVCSN